MSLSHDPKKSSSEVLATMLCGTTLAVFFGGFGVAVWLLWIWTHLPMPGRSTWPSARLAFWLAIAISIADLILLATTMLKIMKPLSDVKAVSQAAIQRSISDLLTAVILVLVVHAVLCALALGIGYQVKRRGVGVSSGRSQVD